MSLLDIGEYSNREPSQTAVSTIQTSPEAPAATPDPAPAPPASPEPAPVVPPPPPHPPSQQDTNLVAELTKQFSKDIGEQPSQPSHEQAPVPLPEKTWRDEQPPQNLTKNAKESWQTFKSKALADVESRDSKIKELESKLREAESDLPRTRAEAEELKKKLSDSLGIVERVAIERSPLFKAKVLDQEDSLRERMKKLVDGTNLTASDVNHLLSGNLTTREQIIERGNLTSFRKTQMADVISRWDQISEDRDRMLNRGRETLQEFIKENQTAQERARAEYMQSSSRIFEDQMNLISPKLEPYMLEGNKEWATNARTVARTIYDGKADQATLAQAAILAPTVPIYQRMLQAALSKINELNGQVAKLQGLSPSVRDSGADAASPGTRINLSSPNGDFVKDLVSKFQKETGLY